MFESADVNDLGELMLSATRVVDGLYTGEHLTAAPGAGVEFQAYRPYTFGDDPGQIDWRVLARTDRFFVRQHQHHSELPAVLCLDCSASMDWPGPSKAQPRPEAHKLAHAKRLVAAMALLLDRQGDAISLAVGDGVSFDWLEAGRGVGHLRELGRRLEQAEGAHPGQREASTGLAGMLARVAKQLARRSLVVVVSDWLDEPGAVLAGAGALRAAGHEVLAFQVLSRAELTPDWLGGGSVQLIEPESGRRAWTRRGDYQERLAAHLRVLRQGLTGPGGDYALLCTDAPVAANLRQVLTQRAAMSR
jgi:uncharacterized protein (DUF58 family)